jgi:imidazolonepropionase-like amidohydrolase
MVAIRLNNASLYNVESDEIKKDQSILIQDGKIVDISRATVTQGRVAGDVEELDIDGGIVLPGLIDMHVHLVWSGGPDPAADTNSIGKNLTLLVAYSNALRSLKSGITTLCDLGGNWDVPLFVASAVDRGVLLGPRIIATGKTVVMTGGHDNFWGIEADGIEAVKSAVRLQVSKGAQIIKTAATGGAYGGGEGEDPGQSEFTAQELFAIADEAHRLGIKVSAHAVGQKGISDSIAAGIDIIHHGIMADGEAIDLMVAKDIALCPTLHTYKTLSKAELGIPAHAVKKAIKLSQIHRETFTNALSAGVNIVAGTDAGAPGLPHTALIDELLAMNDYGMDVAQCIRSATLDAAKALGLASTIGSIKEGLAADLIVVRNDPRQDLRHFSNPEVVVSGGIHVPLGPG